MSLTTDRDATKAQLASVLAEADALQASIATMDAEIAAAAPQSALWDTVEAAANAIADGVADDARLALHNAVAQARALLNL